MPPNTPHLPPWETLRLILPEITLALGMGAVVLTPFFGRKRDHRSTVVALAALFLALVAIVNTTHFGAATILGGMLSVDPFSQFFKALLLVFTGLVIVQWRSTARRNPRPNDTRMQDAPDLLCLLLGASLGMALMASATNLLMIFMATEAASYPSYGLAGFRKRDRLASKGALKYVVFGAASSAAMVYGMSLVYGVTGTLSLAGVALHIGEHGISPLLAMGLCGMFAGLAFKLATVPMHFWCPDVFEGAPTHVTTFLAFASKAAAICLLVRILLAFSAASSDASAADLGAMATGFAALGAVTATWANLFALRQVHIKRLLAYSSIAHAGYMTMTAAVALGLPHGVGSPNTVASAILFYLLTYAFMNLGAFTVAAVIIQRTGAEDIRHYAGIAQRSPLLAGLMTLFLLSLFGMPGLGGFIAKVWLAMTLSGAGTMGFVLIAVLLVNTLVSLYYYLRPVYHMYFTRDDGQRPAFAAAPASLAILLVSALLLLWTGLSPGAADRMTRDFATLAPPLADASGTPGMGALKDPGQDDTNRRRAPAAPRRRATFR
ncbi:MAG: NADH-quinone oxidoreductase subunit N [Planctomycetota bacterium]|nr:NADH-quinone oxidoreductase subunit N [Planctomycetota bacterium]